MKLLVRRKSEEVEKKVRPVDEERGREEDQSGKSIGVDNKDEVAHSSGHGCFAQCG